MPEAMYEAAGAALEVARVRKHAREEQIGDVNLGGIRRTVNAKQQNNLAHISTKNKIAGRIICL